jgi:putative NIF3 family GTP cyclohydrolase 1 type 2
VTLFIVIPRVSQTRVLIILAVSSGFLAKFKESTKRTTVLLEAPYRPDNLKNSVLLTVDLTRGVADEAIARKDSIIVTYREISTHKTELFNC